MERMECLLILDVSINFLEMQICYRVLLICDILFEESVQIVCVDKDEVLGYVLGQGFEGVYVVKYGYLVGVL